MNRRLVFHHDENWGRKNLPQDCRSLGPRLYSPMLTRTAALARVAHRATAMRPAVPARRMGGGGHDGHVHNVFEPAEYKGWGAPCEYPPPEPAIIPRASSVGGAIKSMRLWAAGVVAPESGRRCPGRLSEPPPTWAARSASLMYPTGSHSTRHMQHACPCPVEEATLMIQACPSALPLSRYIFTLLSHPSSLPSPLQSPPISL